MLPLNNKIALKNRIPEEFPWDPFDHSEGHFSLKVKNFEKQKKKLEMGSRDPPVPGGAKKVSEESKTDSKLTCSRLSNSFLTLI